MPDSIVLRKKMILVLLTYIVYCFADSQWKKTDGKKKLKRRTREVRERVQNKNKQSFHIKRAWNCLAFSKGLFERELMVISICNGHELLIYGAASKEAALKIAALRCRRTKSSWILLKLFPLDEMPFCALVCQERQGTYLEISWCWRNFPRVNHRLLLLCISSDKARGPLLSFHFYLRGKVTCEGLMANKENALASHRAAWQCYRCMLGSLSDPSQIKEQVFLCLCPCDQDRSRRRRWDLLE